MEKQGNNGVSTFLFILFVILPPSFPSLPSAPALALAPASVDPRDDKVRRRDAMPTRQSEAGSLIMRE